MRTLTSIVLLSVLVALSARAEEQPVDVYPLRNHNPFLQIFGLPAFQTADIAQPDTWDVGFSIDIANDADDADRIVERLIIDAESRVLNLTVRRRLGERLEVGIDVPYVRHSGGSLDSLIFDFHDLVGLPNSNRDGPQDQYRLFYERQGVVFFDTDTSTSGIGDVQVSAAIAFEKFTLRAAVKAPTGDPEKLTGSGAADLSLGVYRSGVSSLFERPLSYSGFGGVLVLGDGEVMPSLQRSAVPYGGAALRWHATPRFALATQLYVQGPYFDVDLDELGGSTFQLAFGADVRLKRALLRFAIVEDIAAGAAPDFALHLSFRSLGD
jgi:hypothetical protein